jgi:hypothetical protein
LVKIQTAEYPEEEKEQEEKCTPFLPKINPLDNASRI